MSNSVPGNKQPKYGGIKCGRHVKEKIKVLGLSQYLAMKKKKAVCNTANGSFTANKLTCEHEKRTSG
jgi:hypothetical protein